MTGSRNIIKKLALAAFVGGAMLVPTAAFADDDDRRHDRGDRYGHRDHGRHDRHDRHDHRHGNRHHDHDKGRVGVSLSFGDSYVQPAVERVWVPPVYRTECERVWVEPVYRTECQRVWIEPVYQLREVVRWDCGRRIITHERVMVSPGHWENRDHQVLVTPGHYRNVERQVVVSAGYWDTRHVGIAQPAGGVVLNFGFRH
jgi:hypothetical protein